MSFKRVANGVSHSSQQDYRSEQLRKLGLKIDNWDYVVALAGNPNTGKSTVFNALTGLRQHTGNWPGKTVNRAEGGFKFKDHTYKLVDLPGTYSLLSSSEDEEIARNFVLFAQPDVTVVVIDATRIERNLNLALQIMEITGRVVLCLNLMDEAKRNGITIDVDKLENKLGVPVIPTVARYGDGLENLLSAIADVASSDRSVSEHSIQTQSEELNNALNELQQDLDTLYPNLPNTRWLALRLLDGDERIEQAVKTGELEQLVKRYNQTPLNLDEELKKINQELDD
jgi:ferrous iron transport protein B